MITRSRWHRRKARARCLEVWRVLTAFVDGEVEEDYALKIAEHLDDCRRCGMKAEAYSRIKESLQARPPRLDPEAVARLREFGAELTGD